MTDKQLRRLRTQAKARVTWGDRPEDVVEFLIGGGLDPGEAAALVDGLVLKRNREVRSRGLQKLITGAGLVLAVIVFFGALPWRAWMVSLNQTFGSGRRGSLGSMLVLAAGGAGVVGIWWMYRGLCALLQPQAEELSDVE